MHSYSQFRIAQLENLEKAELDKFIAFQLYFGLKRAKQQGIISAYWIILPLLIKHLKQNKDIEFPLTVNSIEFEA
jgi:hypothetical protein